LCAKALRPTQGWFGSGDEVQQLVDEVGGRGQARELLGGQQLVAELELQRGDDRDEVRVARALADAVHRALHLRRALGDGGQRVRHAALEVVVAVDADGDLDRAARGTDGV
jgi:hypothetical protein